MFLFIYVLSEFEIKHVAILVQMFCHYFNLLLSYNDPLHTMGVTAGGPPNLCDGEHYLKIVVLQAHSTSCEAL